jgi:hypothetical protein
VRLEEVGDSVQVVCIHLLWHPRPENEGGGGARAPWVTAVPGRGLWGRVAGGRRCRRLSGRGSLSPRWGPAARFLPHGASGPRVLPCVLSGDRAARRPGRVGDRVRGARLGVRPLRLGHPAAEGQGRQRLQRPRPRLDPAKPASAHRRPRPTAAPAATQPPTRPPVAARPRASRGSLSCPCAPLSPRSAFLSIAGCRVPQGPSWPFPQGLPDPVFPS